MSLKLVATIAGAIAVGVLDNLKGGVVQSIADWVRFQFFTPIYLLTLSEPVEINRERLTIIPVGGDGSPARPLYVAFPPSPTAENRVKYIEISIYPGRYYIRLERMNGSATQVLADQPITFSKPDIPVNVDTASAQWATLPALTSVPGGGLTSGTRWTLAPSDNDALATAEGRPARILKAALGQLGVWEKGNDADRRAIAAYWQATATNSNPPPADTASEYGLWGGAFLAWAVRQGEAKPPNNAAAFRSWENWGVVVDSSRAKPGMIAVIDTGRRQPPNLSGLMVGLLLRRTPDCIEIVTGNLADRVVVSCVKGQIRSIRTPS